MEASRYICGTLALLFIMIGVIATIPQKIIAQGNEGNFTQEFDSNYFEGVEFVSSSYLRIRASDGTFVFRSGNPFDGTHRYERNHVTCDSNISFDGGDFESSGNLNTTATLKYRHVTTSGGTTSCSDEKTFNIPINAAHSARKWDAFTVNENNIFMPIYRTRYGCAQNTSRPNNGLFRRYPSGSIGYNQNHYILMNSSTEYSIPPGNGGVDQEITGGWINTTQNRQYTKRICNTTVTNSHENITLAPADAEVPTPYHAALLNLGVNINEDDGTVTVEEVDDAASGPDPNSCEVQFASPLSWMVCPVMNGLNVALAWFYNAVEDALDFDFRSGETQSDTGTTSGNSGIQNAWGRFRNIANILFIIAFLFIIISQAISGRF